MDINRDILKDIFDEQYTIYEAANGEEAIAQIQSHKDEVALIFWIWSCREKTAWMFLSI